MLPPGHVTHPPHSTSPPHTPTTPPPRVPQTQTHTQLGEPLPQALNLFRRKTGRTQRFRVSLHKRVPHGAGLGGGSANAATALWAANELTGRPASNEELLDWSGEIGSDISVFFSGGAAYCTGRGEVVEDVPPPLPLDSRMLLVKPPVGLSTPEIFKALDLGRWGELHARGGSHMLLTSRTTSFPAPPLGVKSSCPPG